MSHQDTIRDQFSRQAVPFSDARSMTDGDAIQLLVEAARVDAAHRSLDVACGPGMVALAFARVVHSAVGLDTTRAMLDRARVLQHRQSCRNVAWVLGEAAELPFQGASFDIATCRFAIHHMLNPSLALQEMTRVLRPGGRIVICDAVASDDPAKAAALNAFEKLRDPSTVRFLTLAELRSLLIDGGVQIEGERKYRVPVEFDDLMQRSFPSQGDVPRLRDMMVSSLEGDTLGLATRRDDERILFSYPAVVLAGQKPSN
jgi:ubiquinone/menaquinone biosynthesis C-methylase UbiE